MLVVVLRGKFSDPYFFSNTHMSGMVVVALIVFEILVWEADGSCRSQIPQITYS